MLSINLFSCGIRSDFLSRNASHVYLGCSSHLLDVNRIFYFLFRALGAEKYMVSRQLPFEGRGMGEHCVDLDNARSVPQLPFNPSVQVTHSELHTSNHAIPGVLHVQTSEKSCISNGHCICH